MAASIFLKTAINYGSSLSLCYLYFFFRNFNFKIKMTTEVLHVDPDVSANLTDHTDHPLQPNERLGFIIPAVINIVVGIICIAFNGTMLSLWIKMIKIRNAVKPMTLQLYIYCFIEGLTMVIVSIVILSYQNQLPPNACLTVTLFKLFFDAYLLLLLPLLLLEKYLSMKQPFNNTRLRRLAIIGTLIALPLAVLTLLPLHPDIRVRRNLEQYALTNADRELNCGGALNTYNMAHPIIILILISLCVISVAVLCYLIYGLLQQRMGTFSSMTAEKRKQMRKNTTTLVVIAIVFVLMVIPSEIEKQVIDICLANHRHYSVCKQVNLVLIIFSDMLYHLAHFVAPLLFTIYNKKLQSLVLEEIKSCCLSKPAEEEDQPEVVDHSNISSQMASYDKAQER